jgi:PTH1 family peptidyl-tRNA hydrolase
LTFDKRRKRALVALGAVRGQRVILVKPQTFMNESGRSVVPLARFYKVRPGRLLVVYDDLDLPPGTVRMRPEGGSGGHKGMHSIIEHWGGQDFPRLRIGIGRPPGRMDPAAYVLQDFSAEEEPLLEETLERAAAAIEAWLREGVEVAMSQYNQRSSGLAETGS